MRNSKCEAGVPVVSPAMISPLEFRSHAGRGLFAYCIVSGRGVSRDARKVSVSKDWRASDSGVWSVMFGVEMGMFSCTGPGMG